MFSCGSEALDWVYNNCERCEKYDPDSAEKTTCEFSTKVMMGFFNDPPTKEDGAEYNCTGDPTTKCSQIRVKINERTSATRGNEP